MTEPNTKGFNFGPLFIFIAALLWTTDVFVRSSLEKELTAPQLVLLEHVIIGIIISPFIFKYAPNLLRLTPKEWVSVLIIGIGGSALATVALTEGFFQGSAYQYAVQVVFLQQMQPIIAIGLAHALLKEKLPAYYYPLSLTAIIGAFLLVFADDQVGLINGSTFAFNDVGAFFANLKIGAGLTAGILGLTAAVFWGASTVFGRYMLEYGPNKTDYRQMTTYRFFIALLFLLVFVPFYPRAKGYPAPSHIFIPNIFLGLLYLGIVVGLLSLVIYYFGLKTTHASVSTIFELAFPLSFYVIMPFLNNNAQPNLVQKIGSLILVVSATVLLLLNNSINSNGESNETSANIVYTT